MPFPNQWAIPNSDDSRVAPSGGLSETSDGPFDILTFLALAQKRNIDFLPITWYPALDAVGSGGTAEIREALVNLQTSLAFKRLRITKEDQTDTDKKRLQALVAEIVVLSDTAIRGHRFIIELLGICWDIEWRNNTYNVWPVLVFEKSQHGNLEVFMTKGEGQKLSLEDRIKMCAGIAMAIMDMHAANIVHGDIKPLNVLIFQPSSDIYVPKIIDFGYSPGPTGGKNVVKLPYSMYWTHHEWHHNYYEVGEAKKMDAYSFGLLCLWLMFYSVDEGEMRRFYAHLERFYAHLETASGPMSLAEDSIGMNSSLDDKRKENIRTLFQFTLEKRSSEFRKLYHLLALHDDGTELDDTDGEDPDTEPPGLSQQHLRVSYEDFEIAPLMHHLCRAPHEVRAHIVACLEQKAGDSSAAAFELAICYKLGFGLPKDDGKAESLRGKTNKTVGDLQSRIDEVKQLDSTRFEGNIFSDLVNKSQIRAIELAQHYRDKKKLDVAESTYRREITDLEHALGPGHGISLILKSELSAILSNQGRWKEAEALEAQVLEAKKGTRGEDCVSTVGSMTNLAVIYRKQGSWDKAENLERRALELSEAMFDKDKDHLRICSAKANLATTFLHQGRWKDAEELLISVVETRSRTFGKEHPIMTTTLANLATALLNQGRWTEAEKQFGEVVNLNTKVLGQKHPDTIQSRNNLASTYWKQGKLIEAEKEFRSIVDTNKDILGQEHPDTMLSQTNLAITHRDLGLLKQAEELEREVVSLRERVSGKEHPNTLIAITNLATTLGLQGQWKEAEQLQLPAINKCKEVLGQEHPTTLEAMANLVSIYLKEGRYEEAEKLSSTIVETRKGALGEKHPSTITSISDLALIFMNTNRLQEAEELLSDLKETSLEVLGQGNPFTLSILANLGLTYKRQGKMSEAQDLLSSVLHMRTYFLGEERSDTLSSMANLATVLVDLGELDEAEGLLRRAWETHARLFGREHPDTLVCASNLATVLLASNRLGQAEALFTQVIEAKERVFGKDHPSTLTSVGRLALIHRKQGRVNDAEESEGSVARTKEKDGSEEGRVS